MGTFSRSQDQKWYFSERYLFLLWRSQNFVRFALALTVSEISTFSAKTADSALFQGHMTKKLFFFFRYLFSWVFPSSSAYRFEDKHFFCKKGRIGSISWSHDRKCNFYRQILFFLRWSPNFFRFALALTVSEINTFSTKTDKWALFQGHMTKNEIFPSDTFFHMVIKNVVRFALALTVSEINTFSTKTAEWALFQGHKTKNDIFPKDTFFGTFSCKTADSALFQGHMTKNDFFLSDTCFLKWSQNFIHFALALTVSEISTFSAKAAEWALFQGHMNKNEIFPSDTFFC